MVEIPNRVLNKIAILLSKIVQSNYDIEKAYLYGSYAKGTFNELSDIDLALISKDFNIDYLQLDNSLRRINLITDFEVSLEPYTPEEFTEDDLFVKEILSHAIDVTYLKDKKNIQKAE